MRNELKKIIAKNSPLELEEIKISFYDMFADGDITVKNLVDIAEKAFELGLKAKFKNDSFKVKTDEELEQIAYDNLGHYAMYASGVTFGYKLALEQFGYEI